VRRFSHKLLRCSDIRAATPFPHRALTGNFRITWGKSHPRAMRRKIGKRKSKSHGSRVLKSEFRNPWLNRGRGRLGSRSRRTTPTERISHICPGRTGSGEFGHQAGGPVGFPSGICLKCPGLETVNMFRRCGCESKNARRNRRTASGGCWPSRKSTMPGAGGTRR
jgi:hypothetical protein